MTTEDTPSVAARDDLAGVVDLFGWLTRAELSRALSELAFKQRTAANDEAIDAAIDVAVAEYALVPAPPAALSETGSTPDGVVLPAAVKTTSDDTVEAVETSDSVALAVGPAAFPSLPPDAEDLPHILNVPERSVDREALAAAVLDRLSTDAVAAIGASDAERLETLADVTYDIEAWAPVDASDIRERIVAEVDS